MENNLTVSYKTKHRVTVWPSNSKTHGYTHLRNENICSHKKLFIGVHSSVIHNSQKVETAQTSINRWMHKWNADYTCNRILYFKADTRLDLECSYYKKKWQLCEVMEMLANTSVVIILQDINVWNQHTVCFKPTQCYKSIISQFFKKAKIIQI